MKPLTATARFQFHKAFTLDDGAALVPYLQKLGISHLYASPIFKARPGSTHGYDMVDHSEINPEIGGEDALRRLVARLREQAMGLILDIVPNHMGVGGADNPMVARRAGMGPGEPLRRVLLMSTGIRPTLRCAGACSLPFSAMLTGRFWRTTSFI